MGKELTDATGKRISLKDIDPGDTHGMSQEEAERKLPAMQERLGDLHNLLYGATHQSLLIVLQGLDTAGKDGSVKHLMQGLNPIGCDIASFKQPTAEELAHDFLWRIHKRTPALGWVTIFNRSHYEDVLVVRVHELVPKSIWEQRYAQINDFERRLTVTGTIIVKFYLHISKKEQRERLLEREREPAKAWKLSVSDWKERERWKAYREAYEDAISRCGTKDAPWTIVPADKKWYRNYMLTQTLIDRLEPYAKAWSAELAERGEKALAAIRAYHAGEKPEEPE
ncbi:MAG TPA: PPK2 family polyphosphate kinase [Ktedonobacterales bacterium]|jgi:PPK2 family polyphosphate:nucleotide phosphotransferase